MKKREKAFVTMEVDPPPPPEAPPPLPPVVGMSSEDRFAALDAPVHLPDFPGQPFSVSLKGIFYLHADGRTTCIGPPDCLCDSVLLYRFCKRNCQAFVVKGRRWKKLAAQLDTRRRFIAKAVLANPQLIRNHIRPGSKCSMYMCSECNAFADMDHRSNLTDSKRHKDCTGGTILRVTVVKYRCGRPLLKSSLPAAAPSMLVSPAAGRSTATDTADCTVLVPTTGTAAAARPARPQQNMNVPMANGATTSTGTLDMTTDEYWHSPPGLMAITEDIFFQPETEIVPVLDRMMAPLLEGRDEKPQQYMFLFHPFLRDGCPLPGGQWTEENWVDNISNLLEVVDGGIPVGHTILEVAWAATEKWIDFDMATDHDAVPATVRSRLNTVGRYGGDAEEGPENSGTHTLRRNWEGYKIAAKRYLPYLFLYNFICTDWEEQRIQHLIDISGDSFDTAVARVRKEGIIPRLITKSLVHVQQRYYNGTPVHAFLLAHVFSKVRGAEENGIHVNRPNTAAKPLSSFLALTKVAMQSAWCKYQNNVEGAQKVEVEKICEGPVYSIICTAISRFRMMQKSEPHDAPSEIDDDGTVWVRSIRYRPEITFRLIPMISSQCRNILEKIMIGSAWTLLFKIDRDNVTIGEKCSTFMIHHFGDRHTSTKSESMQVNFDQHGIDALLKRLMGLVLLSLTIL